MWTKVPLRGLVGSLVWTVSSRKTCSYVRRCRAHELTESNKKARLSCCRKLLRQCSTGIVNFIWLTDKKQFTIAAPSNTQNNGVYAPSHVRKSTSYLAACYDVARRSSQSLKAKFHYAILIANQLATWSQTRFATWSPTCSELEFGLLRTI